jgi:hypothetical protein
VLQACRKTAIRTGLMSFGYAAGLLLAGCVLSKKSLWR